MLVLQNISVSFQQDAKLKNKVLRNINLKFNPGELVALIGGNGAGKSTLLNTISGEIKAHSGKITLAGSNLSKLSQIVAKVVQDPSIGTIANMTIEENLAFAMSRGQSRNLKFSVSQQRRAFFSDKLKLLGIKLERRLNEQVADLSGGQRQALSLIMATLVPAKILLLDEHTAALDPKMAKVIMRITKDLIVNDQLIGVMITHNMSEALAFCDRIILVHEGRILKQISRLEKNKFTLAKLSKFFNQKHLL